MLKMVGTGVQSAREREFERLNAADVATLADSRVNIPL
jgi:hypothetical protein